MISKFVLGQVYRPNLSDHLTVELKPGDCLLVALFADSARSFAVCIDPISGKGWDKAILALGTRTNSSSVVIKAVSSGPKATEANEMLAKRLIEAGWRLTSSAARDGSITQCQVLFSDQRLRVTKSAPGKIRVLIVDDSKTIHALLSQVLSKDPDIEVIGTVADPTKAEGEIARLKPDVITLDIHMPGINGVELLGRYLPKYPIPTVMVSSITREEGPMVFNALELGAVDYIQKPTFLELSTHAPQLVEKIKQAARAKVRVSSVAPIAARKSGAMDPGTLIVIGASTGGTEAIKEVLTSLPAEIPPILIVQHIPPVFSRAFADRLNSICPFEVKEAADGDAILPGRVLLAPGGFQMEVNSGCDRVIVNDAPPMNRHKPSVDHLFFSVSRSARRSVVAAILTGMGADGADGLVSLRKAGARTVGQDEATSVVFGMPREAMERGGVEVQLPIGRVADQLIEWSAVGAHSRTKRIG